MKIALIGGHLAPALAILDNLPSDAEVFFVGRKFTIEGESTLSLEYKTITERNISFYHISTGKFQRHFSLSTIRSLSRIPGGFFQSLSLLQQHRPDVVMGFGGYISVPVALAAFFLRIPVVIHEQTLEAGLANKIIALFAQRICLSWKQSERFFPKKKSVLTGNPLRTFSIGQLPDNLSTEHLPLLYITGGSAGSHAINALVERSLEKLLHHYRIIHQTGDVEAFSDFERLSRLHESLPQKLQKRYFVTKFVSPADVGTYMNAADLIVCRSGINTVTELLYFGKPSFLIPLPLGQKNEQLKNAQFVKKAGIAEYRLQSSVTDSSFLHEIEQMIEKKAHYLVHAQKARELVKEDAPERIIKVLYESVNKK